MTDGTRRLRGPWTLPNFITLLRLPWYSGVARTTAVAFLTDACNFFVPSAPGLVPGNGKFNSAGLINSTVTFGSFFSSSTTRADAMLV